VKKPISGYKFYTTLPELNGRRIQVATTIPKQKLDTAMEEAGFTAVMSFPSNHGEGAYRITLWARGKGIRYLTQPPLQVSKRLSK